MQAEIANPNNKSKTKTISKDFAAGLPSL